MDLFLRILIDVPRFMAPFSGGDIPLPVPVRDQSRPPNTYLKKKPLNKTNDLDQSEKNTMIRTLIASIILGLVKFASFKYN